jgi:hypothetical protein
MTAEISNVNGRVVTLRVSGHLSQNELTAVQAETSRIIGAGGKIRILVVAEDFRGWEKGGTWDDFAFQAAHDDDIERMAIVGEAQWQQLALMFTSKGLRPFPIEYFTPERLAEARAWLAEN